MLNYNTNKVSLTWYETIKDYAILFKYKLTLFVVFSAMMAYMASITGPINWTAFGILFLGGFCITAAANTLNQVLEKDFDKLMKRTADRPVAAGRMTAAHAVFVGGLLWILGMVFLSYFNPIATFLGAFAVVSYAFIYTPVKRYSTIAVFIGSFPGAIPLLIGNVAASGTIDQMGIFLFSIQFIWQFPHFWAIGWLGFEEYTQAGYKLIATKNGERDPKTGLNAAFYALLFIPLAICGYYINLIGIASLVTISIASIIFAYFGYRLYQFKGRSEALGLMFASLVFLAVALGVVYFDKFLS